MSGLSEKWNPSREVSEAAAAAAGGVADGVMKQRYHFHEFLPCLLLEAAQVYDPEGRKHTTLGGGGRRTVPPPFIAVA